MNLEKYDKVIWRVNGTLLLLACIAGLLLPILLGARLFGDANDRHAHDMVAVNQSTKKQEYLRLGYFSELKGTEQILIPLIADTSYDRISIKSGYGGHARNYLVFNTKTKESYWIWKSNAYQTMQETRVHDKVIESNSQKTIGLVLEFVESDANADEALDDRDPKSVQYFDLASRKARPIVDKVDRVIGVQQVEDSEVLFFYSRGGKSFFKTLTLSSSALSDEKEIGLPL